jgi:phosphoglycolate phosphatase
MTITEAGGHPEHAIMVGDSNTDIQTAKLAKIPVVAVNFGYSETSVELLNPDRVIEHYDHLYEVAIMLTKK